MEKQLGPKGSKLFEKRKDKSFVRQVDNLAATMRGFQKEPGNLKEYSPWLTGFKADPFSNELEIPGQQLEKVTTEICKLYILEIVFVVFGLC